MVLILGLERYGFRYLLLMLVCVYGNGHAASSITQTVSFVLSTINSISVSGNPGALTVNAAVAGSQPTSATDSTTTYNLTSNGTNQRITGAIDVAMPTGISLLTNLSAPSGATSAGFVSLTTTAKNLVTGITNVQQSNVAIQYQLQATVAAGAQGPLTRTVTFTLGP